MIIVYASTRSLIARSRSLSSFCALLLLTHTQIPYTQRRAARLASTLGAVQLFHASGCGARDYARLAALLRHERFPPAQARLHDLPSLSYCAILLSIPPEVLPSVRRRTCLGGLLY